MIKKPQPTHGQLVTPVALDHRVHPTSDPTSELVIYAVFGPGKQPSRAASSCKQDHNWGGGSVSRGCDPRGCVACC